MLEQLKGFTKRIKQELALYRLIAKHPDTPWLAKMCFGFAIGYLLLPFDLIPDFIPVTGLADDISLIFLVFASVNEDIQDFLDYEQSKSKDFKDSDIIL